MQAMVLVAFNQNDHMSYKELIQVTGMSEQELNVQLISLALMEHKVLAICKNKPDEIDAETQLKKSISTAVEPNEQINQIDT